MRNPKKGIRVLVADNSDIYLKGCYALLNGFDFIEAVGEARNFHELNSLTSSSAFDIVLIDPGLIEVEYDKFFENIRIHNRKLKVVGMTAAINPERINKFLSAGAHGFISKSISKEELYTLLKNVLINVKSISKDIHSKLFPFVVPEQHPEPEGIWIRLSERHRELLFLISHQLSSKQIAMKMCLSVKSIDTYRKRLFHWFHVDNVVGLAYHAFLNNIHVDNKLRDKFRIESKLSKFEIVGS